MLDSTGMVSVEILGVVEVGTVDDVVPTEIDGENKVLDVLVPISSTELLVAVEVVVKPMVLG